MNPRTKNLVMVGGAVALVGFVGVNTLMPAPPAVTGAATSPGEPVAEPSGSATAAQDGPAIATQASPDVVLPESSPSPGSGADAVHAARRSYAVGLHDLAGLAPDAAPGARLELWVTWEPPLTDEPRLQKLIGDVVLERTISGSVPEAPVTILLSVPADRVSDLIYADTFGKLSVTVPG